MKGFVPPPRFGGAANFSDEPLPITREITVTEGISVKDLAEKLEIRAKDLIAILLMRGVFVTVNQSLDAEMVKDVAAKFGAAATVISYEEELENQAIEEVLDTEKTDFIELSRAPVVTVMGHVDHGKTSLLDAIRETDVAAGEAGGITQHIGAYKVRFTKEGSPASGREIVFLDTPGHEAFTRMRARGAKVTDIVVIVVAADDGAMPQTIEAIDHAKAADVPIIVAVNKIDKPEANPDRVMKQLADRGLTPDEWGGETPYVKVSAKKRENLDRLLEMICLVSDIKAPKATPGRKAAVALQIELVGVDLEGVARVARHDRPPAPVDALDRRAKPRDVDRNGMGRRRRRTLPHSVDERVRGHRPAVAEHQGGQNRTRLLAAQPDRPGVTDDLDRSEHPKIHRNPLPPSPAVAVCIECGKATTWPVDVDGPTPGHPSTGTSAAARSDRYRCVGRRPGLRPRRHRRARVGRPAGVGRPPGLLGPALIVGAPSAVAGAAAVRAPGIDARRGRRAPRRLRRVDQPSCG